MARASLPLTGLRQCLARAAVRHGCVTEAGVVGMVREETMAATMRIEMDCGSGCSPEHPHNGYWAGDFSAPPGDIALEETYGRRTR